MRLTMLTWPNRVTLFRILLLFGLVVLIYQDHFWVRISAAALSIILIILDWLDGFLARRLNEHTKLGGLLDIAGDRIVEIVLWICLRDIRLIPVWIPITVISRGILTDTVRGYVLQYGYAIYGKDSMMRTALGQFLTGSPVMRSGYAVLKAFAFGLLLLVSAFQFENYLSEKWVNLGLDIGYWIAVAAAIVCIIRGLPVIIEGTARIIELDSKLENE
jgi:CDP-diacylglycerol---glycerol-3-phosphate 3-phosphatidyltransferase